MSKADELYSAPRKPLPQDLGGVMKPVPATPIKDAMIGQPGNNAGKPSTGSKSNSVMN